MIVNGYVPLEVLQRYRDEELITTRAHPAGELLIHNYTARCIYTHHWDEVTRNCRGLITDLSGKVVARSFAKFFNLQELSEFEQTELEGKPFTVTRKEDGSLGILYYDPNGKVAIATRGSFTSEQAQVATRLLYTQYPDFCRKANANPRWRENAWTLLFEIVYPQNKIVMDYGGASQLILLAQLSNKSGAEAPYDELVNIRNRFFPEMPVVPSYSYDWHQLPVDLVNEEGFVIAFHHTCPPARVKVKMAEYVRLQALLIRVSNKAIWECLCNGDSLDLFLENVPDEFYAWVRSVETSLRTQYVAIEQQCLADFRSDFETRKEVAFYILSRPYPHILFKMLDGKPYSEAIWKLIEPKRYTVFVNEEAT